jgi:hypothetical protein
VPTAGSSLPERGDDLTLKIRAAALGELEHDQRENIAPSLVRAHQAANRRQPCFIARLGIGHGREQFGSELDEARLQFTALVPLRGQRESRFSRTAFEEFDERG